MTSYPIGLDAAGKIQYWFDSRGRDTSAFIEVDITTGNRTELASDVNADASDVEFHPASEKRTGNSLSGMNVRQAG